MNYHLLWLKMTHELKHIIQIAFECFKKHEKCVLATVVALDGTSYRKPGVRMLISEAGAVVGAVSGGCVEKDIQQRAELVFQSDKPLVMSYDGRYRLGCQGTLYILIEPFEVSEDIYQAFDKHCEKRLSIELKSYYQKEDDATGCFGTTMQLAEDLIQFNPNVVFNPQSLIFSQQLKPCFKLLIIGAEHDAVKLCAMAGNMGWEVEVVSGWRDPKTQSDFPGANTVYSLSPEMFEVANIDSHTAVVLMTHNYALDLKYLLRLKNVEMAYLGVLGSSNRNDQLRSELLEYADDLDELQFYGPAGLDLGSETPEEIALAIIAEILAHTRNRNVPSLSTHLKSVRI